MMLGCQRKGEIASHNHQESKYTKRHAIFPCLVQDTASIACRKVASGKNIFSAICERI